MGAIGMETTLESFLKIRELLNFRKANHSKIPEILGGKSNERETPGNKFLKTWVNLTRLFSVPKILENAVPPETGNFRKVKTGIFGRIGSAVQNLTNQWEKYVLISGRETTYLTPLSQKRAIAHDKLCISPLQLMLRILPPIGQVHSERPSLEGICAPFHLHNRYNSQSTTVPVM